MKPFVRSIRLERGFTLIELLIVIAVIAILASIAYPSYMGNAQKTRRNLASGCLMEFAQWMERNYTTCLVYNKTGTSCSTDVTAASIPSSCKTDLATYYDFSFASTPALSAKAYQLQAVPKTGSAQASDPCGTLTLNQSGTKGAGGTDCWRK